MGASAATPEQTEPGGRVPRKSCRARTGQFECASSARPGLSPARADWPGRDGNAPGPGRLEGQLIKATPLVSHSVQRTAPSRSRLGKIRDDSSQRLRRYGAVTVRERCYNEKILVATRTTR